MPKMKPGGKIKITPEKPKNAIKKLEKNGFVCRNRRGGDWFYSKIKNGVRKVALVSVHPKDLGIPFVKNIIRSSGKTNEEWVNL